jgi:Flp pilus assembly pilin Flp
MKQWLQHLIDDKRGQDLAEYALLLGFIAILMVVTLASLGFSVNLRFGDASARMSGALTPGGGGQNGSSSGGGGSTPGGDTNSAGATGNSGGSGGSRGGGGSDSGGGSSGGGSATDDDRDGGQFDPPSP